jgi:hypothetical protein
MHSRPTADELISAVQQHLTERVIPTLTDPQIRYHTLVAVNVLGIVGRELGQGEQAVWQEWAVLSALLGERRPQPDQMVKVKAEITEMNTRLSSEILAGQWDDDPNLLLALKQQVAAKLDVSNPKFKR